MLLASGPVKAAAPPNVVRVADVGESGPTFLSVCSEAYSSSGRVYPVKPRPPVSSDTGLYVNSSPLPRSAVRSSSKFESEKEGGSLKSN